MVPLLIQGHIYRHYIEPVRLYFLFGGTYEYIRALYEYLLTLGCDKISMTFSELEQVLGFTLPKSAYAYPAWWANNGQGHTHAQAWLDAGYKVEDVDLRAKTVGFLKSGAL